VNRGFSGAVAAALLVFVAEGAAQSPLEVPYRLVRLDNGLSVILHQDRSVPVVSVNVWYRVGSANEEPGRTGLAHLFEHLMFEGSKHVPTGEFDRLLEAAGGSNNATADNDRTFYYEDLPSNALELALYLESDRMGYLLEGLSQETLDNQRDVVKNERRQRYDDAPYGRAWLELDTLLFPAGHPYSWSGIGSMADLSATTFEDVARFFRTYYVPNNASVSVAGDIDLDEAERLVRKWFSEIPRGTPVEPLSVSEPALDRVVRKTLTDRVQIPRLFLAWLTPKAFAADEPALEVAAAILADGKGSRLNQALVYGRELAQDVSAYQDGRALAGSFQVIATAKPGVSLDTIQAAIDHELDRLRTTPPDAAELARVINGIEASFYRAMERVGSYRGKALQLNAYYNAVGEPDYFAADLARYKAVTPAAVQAAVAQYLSRDRRVELQVVPEEGR